MNRFTLSVVLLFLLAGQGALAKIDNFHKITERIYRGSQPQESDVKWLAEQGFRTIISIDDDRRTIEKEKQWAARYGLRMISIPLSGFDTPRDPDVNRVLDLLEDENLGPVFLHCHYGRDRTGVVSGLYRVEVQGWSARDAYDEMLSRGFRRFLVRLDRYFRQRAGL